MRGLSKDPRQRYPDSVAFARDLAEALSKTEEPSKSGIFSRVKDIFKR
jgi:hypothetical protein